jgi:hypothetical protein
MIVKVSEEVGEEGGGVNCGCEATGVIDQHKIKTNALCINTDLLKR